MKGIFNLKKAVTVSEAIVTMIILGIIAAIVIPAIHHRNPVRDGRETLVIKASEAINQAVVQIITNNSVFGNFLRITDGQTFFSIEDDEARDRIPGMFKYYIQYLDLPIDLNHEYYNLELQDVQKHKLGASLKDLYSNFFWNQNGVLIGFRFYDDCNQTELNSNAPPQRGVYVTENVCASIFFDVNGFEKPNLIGNDQFIMPINKIGIVYE